MGFLAIKSRKQDCVGNILELFISKKSVNRMTLDESGVINDKFYGKNLNRSVLISSIDSYKLAYQKSINLKLGELGENIVMDYNPYYLNSGAKIQIGDEVILEISQNCTLCKSLTKIDNRLPKLLKEDRGVFAKVIKAGEIKNRDRIYIL